MYDDITKVVDKYFTFLDEFEGLHYIPSLTPEDMKDKSRPPKWEASQRWKTIPSTVTDNQIREYERKIGMQLPKSYKYFLQYKNFVDIAIGEDQIVFFKNLSANWMETLLEQTEFYRQKLEGRGLIPFADFNDAGVVCFDYGAFTGADREYPIVWLGEDEDFDHENSLATNFVELFKTFSVDLDSWILQKQEAKRKGE